MSFKPNMFKASFYPEPTFRRGPNGDDSAMASGQGLWCDFTTNIEDVFEWLLPDMQFVQKNYMGGGRNDKKIHQEGYKAKDGSITSLMSSGIFLYYALGSCNTLGTSYASPITDTIASISSNVVTLTGGGLTVDAHIGDVMKITSSGDYLDKYFWIIDNTATTLTVYPDPSGLAGTETIEILTAPFTHTISTGSTIPSFTLHLEAQKGTSSIYKDLFGCIVKSIEITMEAGAETPISMSVGILVPKNIAGATSTNPVNLEKSEYSWTDVSTLTLQYNSNDIESSLRDKTNKVTFKVENEFDIKSILGDDYPKNLQVGTQTITTLIDLFPESTTWDTITGLKIPNYSTQYTKAGYYTGPISFETKITREGSADDYIDISATKLFMDPTSWKIQAPSWDEKEMGGEVSLLEAPGNSWTFVIKDSLHNGYYEAQR